MHRPLWLLLALVAAWLLLALAALILQGVLVLPLLAAAALASWMMPLALSLLLVLGGWLALAALTLAHHVDCDGGWLQQLACRLAAWQAPAVLLALVAALPAR